MASASTPTVRPRPKGRAPTDYTWDAAQGEYIHNETGAVHVKGTRSAASAAQQQSRKRKRGRDERNENDALKAARALRNEARRRPMPLVTPDGLEKLLCLHYATRADDKELDQQWRSIMRRGARQYPGTNVSCTSRTLPITPHRQPATAPAARCLVPAQGVALLSRNVCHP